MNSGLFKSVNSTVHPKKVLGSFGPGGPAPAPPPLVGEAVEYTKQSYVPWDITEPPDVFAICRVKLNLPPASILLTESAVALAYQPRLVKTVVFSAVLIVTQLPYTGPEVKSAYVSVEANPGPVNWTSPCQTFVGSIIPRT